MSYMELLKAWLKERQEEDLQALPPSLYTEVGGYIMRMREETRMMERGTTRSRISERERENVEKMIEDLFRLRLRKIVLAELSGKEVEAERLTMEERSFLFELKRALSEHQENLKSILRGRVPEVKAKPRRRSDLKVIRILEHIPAIMGIDLKTYGPFKPEDVAAIPEENAENLIRRGLAVEVEEESP
ncbi:MAG: hypothetical protein ACETVR_01605 [Candidatus Bathyarchaeia archaeon]